MSYFSVLFVCAADAVESDNVPMSDNPAYVALESTYQIKRQETDKSLQQVHPPDMSCK